MSKEFKVSDLFKSSGEVRAKAKYDYNQGITSYSKNVYANNFTPSHYRNSTNNTFSTIVRNEDIKEIRLVEGYNIVDFPIANNRVEFFYAPDGAKVDYKEITKIEEIEPSQYSSDATNQLKKIGFTDFYQLYKVNEFGLEVELCQMATR
nr:hypothetical protein [uncultured Romboutsia sp.]